MSQPTSTRTRLRPDQRRLQLLDLGVGLLATRSLDEPETVDEMIEAARRAAPGPDLRVV